MNFFRHCSSSSNIKTPKIKIIEDLLDKTAPTSVPSNLTNCKKNNSKEAIKAFKDEDEEKTDSINYYPQLDTSIWTRSCKKEVIEPLNGTITGNIPEWLKGTLLRNGPGSLEVGDYKFQHLFDSSALLHRFEINDGKVIYQSRFVQTDVYKKNHAANRIVVTEFGTKRVPDPCQSIFSRISSIFRSADESDNTMISVYPLGDEYYTFTEFPVIHRIDPKTLETLDTVNVSKYVNIVSHTSHPHIMKNGTVYNLGMTTTSKGPAYSIVEFSDSKFSSDNQTKKKKLSIFDQAKIVSTVSPRWTFHPSYMHTFGITKNYFIIVEQPLILELKSVLMRKLKNDPLCAALKWFGDEDTHIYLVSRKNGKLIKTFVAEAFFYLHIINQYETKDGNHVILDICCYRDPKMIECMYIEAIKNANKNPDYCKLFRGRPLRFVLPLKDNNLDLFSQINVIETNNKNEELETIPDYTYKNKVKRKKPETSCKNENIENLLQREAKAFKLSDSKTFVVPELLCDIGCETPRINYESNLGEDYRYFYAICSDVDRENAGMLLKVDTKLKTKLIWCESNVYPSEPIFIPDPNGKNEDDGIVLSSLIWGKERETQIALLILNAITFEEIARATFETPGPVPKCLHGWFSSSIT